MKPKSGANQGEGNPEAARRFNEVETTFVNSQRGKKVIADLAKVKPEVASGEAQADTEGMTRDKR